MAADQFRRLAASAGQVIKDVCEEHGVPFTAGCGYYLLTKSETVGPGKQMLLVDDGADDGVRDAAEIRSLLGVGAGSVKISPAAVPKGKQLFIQSTSNSRKLSDGPVLVRCASAPKTAAPVQRGAVKTSALQLGSVKTSGASDVKKSGKRPRSHEPPPPPAKMPAKAAAKKTTDDDDDDDDDDDEELGSKDERDLYTANGQTAGRVFLMLSSPFVWKSPRSGRSYDVRAAVRVTSDLSESDVWPRAWHGGSWQVVEAAAWCKGVLVAVWTRDLLGDETAEYLLSGYEEDMWQLAEEQPEDIFSVSSGDETVPAIDCPALSRLDPYTHVPSVPVDRDALLHRLGGKFAAVKKDAVKKDKPKESKRLDLDRIVKAKSLEDDDMAGVVAIRQPCVDFIDEPVPDHLVQPVLKALDAIIERLDGGATDSVQALADTKLVWTARSALGLETTVVHWYDAGKDYGSSEMFAVDDSASDFALVMGVLGGHPFVYAQHFEYANSDGSSSYGDTYRTFADSVVLLKTIKQQLTVHVSDVEH